MLASGHLAPLGVFLGAALSLAVVLAVLAVASLRHRRHRAAVAIRIHVAGSRGKSTTVRLIAAALRANGLRVIAKTTGTRTRLIAIDGTEQDWPRCGPASIREQARFFARAARERADAVVVECMAIRPELVAASERYYVRATTTVVTNARADHAEDLDGTDAAMAASLVHAVPVRGRLVISDEIDAAPFLAAAARLDTDVTIVATTAADPLAANALLASAAARAHGVDAALLPKAFAGANPDPGAFVRSRIDIAGRDLEFANAFACNDVESFLHLWHAHADGRPRIILFNARGDRPLRTRSFLAAIAALRPCPIVFLAGGGRGLHAAARRAGLGADTIEVLATGDPARALERLAASTGEGGAIWGVGNFRGLGERLSDHLRGAPPC